MRPVGAWLPVWTLDGVEVILKERMSEPRVLAFLRSFVAASQLFDRIHFLRGGSMNFNRPKVRACECVQEWVRV